MKILAKHFGLAVGLGQAIWAKIIPKLLHLWRQSQTIHTPTKNFIFEWNLLDKLIRLSPWTAL